jgi:hypothetical protein
MAATIMGKTTARFTPNISNILLFLSESSSSAGGSADATLLRKLCSGC